MGGGGRGLKLRAVAAVWRVSACGDPVKRGKYGKLRYLEGDRPKVEQRTSSRFTLMLSGLCCGRCSIHYRCVYMTTDVVALESQQRLMMSRRP